MNRTELAYRKMAAAGASGFGLLIALYDTLAGDLRRGAEAERNNDIEKRCRELNHALLVVAYLEEWVGRGSGGELADQLTVFYGSLRRNILQAQVKRSPEMLARQMEEVLKIRSIWQDVELRGSSSTPEAPRRARIQDYPGATSAQYAHASLSWSA